MTARQSLIKHTALTACEHELLRKLDKSKPGDIHFLIGMPGAGKSEIRYSIMNKIAGDPSKWGRGRLPLTCVRAAPTDRSRYCPKDMDKRLLLSVREPNFDWLKSREEIADTDVVHKEADELIASEAWRILKRSETGKGLRIAFEQTARNRGLRMLYLEQGTALTFTSKTISPADNMNSLISLTEEIPLVLVVVGTPRVRALWSGDGEVRRRCTFTYFRRYQWNNTKDREDIYRLCLNLTQGLKFAPRAKLKLHYKLVYAATLAVFDEMKRFYARAENNRITSGSEVIDMSHLEAAVHNEEDLTDLYTEAKALDEISQPCSLTQALKLLKSAP